MGSGTVVQSLSRCQGRFGTLQALALSMTGGVLDPGKPVLAQTGGELHVHVMCSWESNIDV